MVPILCRGPNVTLANVSLEDLMLKRQLCRYQLAVLDKLNPGMTRMRGKFLFELLDIEVFLMSEAFNNATIDVDDFKILLNGVLRKCAEICSCLEDDGLKAVNTSFEESILASVARLKQSAIDIIGSI